MNTRFNIGFIGDRNVGKSRLIHGLISPNLEYYPYITIGSELKTLTINEKNSSIKFSEIWKSSCILM